MRFIVAVLPALVLAGCADGQARTPPGPRDAQAKVPPLEYRSAFDGYRAFADEELADWRKANDEVGAAGGHAGRHK